jgi:hypothetical protein
LHDEFSHGADVLRAIALDVRDSRQESKMARKPSRRQAKGHAV